MKTLNTILVIVVLAFSLIGCADTSVLDEESINNETNNDNPICGDGKWEAGEACDGNDVATCVSRYGEGSYLGTITCSVDCKSTNDTCEVVAVFEECGNSVVEGSEQCDGNVFDQDLLLGCNPQVAVAACKSDCTAWCKPLDSQEVCGNGEVETGEECDSNNLEGQTCLTLGYDGGSLSCTSACSLNRTACYNNEPEPVCGDSSSDECSVGQTADCSEAFSNKEGTITCSDSCNWDLSGCTYVSNPSTCGNGTKDFSEACDDTNFGGVTCELLGHTGGSLACSSDCSYIDESACTDDVVNTTPAVCIAGKNNMSIWGFVSRNGWDTYFSVGPGRVVCGDQFVQLNGHNGSNYLVGYRSLNCSTSGSDYDIQFQDIEIMVDSSRGYVTELGVSNPGSLPLSYVADVTVANGTNYKRNVYGEISVGIVHQTSSDTAPNLLLGVLGSTSVSYVHTCAPGEKKYFYQQGSSVIPNNWATETF